MVGKAVLISALVLLSATSSYAAKPMYGAKAIGGDTIAARDGDDSVIVRLYGIDAPDEGQMGHKAGESALRVEAIEGKSPLIVSQVGKETDQYGRVHAVVTRDGVCINKQLVFAGAAVVNPDQCHIPECQDWLNAQSEAQKHRIGFWSLPGQPMPWDERKARYRDVEAKETGYIEGVQYKVDEGRVVASVPEMPKEKFVDYPRPIFFYGGGTTIIHRTFNYVAPPPERPSRYRVY